MPREIEAERVAVPCASRSGSSRLPDARGSCRCSSRESQRLEARRWLSRDARLEKGNSGPRPVGPRDDGRDRI